MSKMVIIHLISHFFHIAADKVEDLYITDYYMKFEQALNIGNLYRGGKFELMDSREKQSELIEQIAHFKKKGKL